MRELCSPCFRLARSVLLRTTVRVTSDRRRPARGLVRRPMRWPWCGSSTGSTPPRGLGTTKISDGGARSRLVGSNTLRSRLVGSATLLGRRLASRPHTRFQRRRKDVQHSGQPGHGVDGRIPVSAGTTERQRAQGPVVLAPQQRHALRHGLGERRHSLVAYTPGDLDIGGEHDTRADGAQKFHVCVAWGRCRLRSQFDVHVGADRSLHRNDGRRIFDVEQHELLAPPHTANNVQRGGVFRLRQQSTTKRGDEFVVVGGVRVALRLRPHLSDASQLVSTRSVHIEKGDRARKGDRCKSEPHHRHRVSAYSFRSGACGTTRKHASGACGTTRKHASEGGLIRRGRGFRR